MNFIRDAEIENTLLAYSAPLFRAAGLDPSAVQIYIVNDRSLNAFVAGGQNLFVHTGFLVATEHSGQVIGVIAHETGHIEGGHLARTHQALSKASAASILALVLGGAAAAAAGRGDAAGAVVAGSQTTGQGVFLHYSRGQESAADNAAVRLLNATGQSGVGLVEFLQTLEDQELLVIDRQDPYVRSHPVTRNRIIATSQLVAASPYKDVPPDPLFEQMHQRMRGKLYGFLYPAGHVARIYKSSDTSFEARYAWSIAYFRKGDLETALKILDGLIAEQPNDPYLLELRGQFLRESGRPVEALPFYQEAVRLLPGEPLLRGSLAKTQLDIGGEENLKSAVINFKAALRLEPAVPFNWRQLAIAYGRLDRKGESSLALAEEALLKGNIRDANYHAGRAAGLLEQGSPGWLQAQDILQAARGGRPAEPPGR